MNTKPFHFTPQNISYLILFFAASLFLLSILYQSHNIQSSAQMSNTLAKSTIIDSTVSTPASLPTKIMDIPFETSSKASYAIDVNSMSVLYEYNQNDTLPIASIAKLMTALLAVEHYSPDDWLIVDGVKTDGSNIGLVSGEKYQVKDLLGALLIGSANDVAEVLASNFTNGINGFVWGMNQKALELGLNNTHFVNPIGFDSSDQYSTARDLAILSIEVIKNPLLSSLVSQKEIVITDQLQTITLQAKSTNELLDKDPSVLGVKTGWTEAAGECLIVYANRNNHPVITVVLGSSNRFEESENLINWIYQSYQWKSVANLRSRV